MQGGPRSASRAGWPNSCLWVSSPTCILRTAQIEPSLRCSCAQATYSRGGLVSGKRIAIVQSNYIPWKGYFDLIARVDEFVLYDDMQYTRRDWRNRNQIKTPQGVQWLTVPVLVKGKYFQKIRDTELAGDEWAPAHWKTLELNYRRAARFAEISAWLEPLYLCNRYTHLSHLNRVFIDAVCTYLGITTKISNSWDYNLLDGKTERLADLCAQAGGTEYIS